MIPICLYVIGIACVIVATVTLGLEIVRDFMRGRDR